MHKCCLSERGRKRDRKGDDVKSAERTNRKKKGKVFSTIQPDVIAWMFFFLFETFPSLSFPSLVTLIKKNTW